MSDENLSCSFCGISKVQTKILVAGEDAHICDQCIEQAYSILNHQTQTKENSQEHPKSWHNFPVFVSSFYETDTFLTCL